MLRRVAFLKPALPIELYAVPDIVPNAVEATGERGFGRHEGVGYPHDKHGIFLPTCLRCTDGLGIVRSYTSAEGKLQHAGKQRHAGERFSCPPTVL